MVVKPISCVEIVPTIQIRGLYLLLLCHVCEFGHLPGYSRSSYLHVLPEQHDKKQLAYYVRSWYVENIEPAFISDMFHHHSCVLYVRVCRLRDVPFRQYVGVRTRCCILVCLSTAPTRGFFVCVWVNRNGRRLETVKISGSRSGDYDDYCCWALTQCNLLDRYCCFGGMLWYMKKGQWCWEGRKGLRLEVYQWQNLIFVPRRLGQQIPPTRCYVSTELHSILYQKKVVLRIRNVGVFWLW